MKLSKQIRYDKFAKAYIETGENAARSAVIAGYSEPSARQTGWKLLREPYIQQKISEIRSKLDIDIAETAPEELKQTLTDWLDLKKACLEKHDRTNAVRCQENISRIIGAYEKDNTQSRELQIIVNESTPEQETGQSPTLKVG